MGVSPIGERGEPRLRVLHLVVLRFWSAVAWHAVTMGAAMAQRGHACWLGGQAGTPVLAEARRAGIAAGPTLPRLRPWNWAGCVGRLREFIAHERIDVVFVHTGSGQVELAVARAGLPVAIVRVRADARVPHAGLAARWTYRHAAERVAVTGAHMLAEQLAALRLPAGRGVHLPPAIDLAAIECDRALGREAARAEIARRHGLPADRPWIGIIGRLSPVKGHADLVDAAALLAGRGLDFRLLIVGAEKEVACAALAAQAAALGLGERILCTGHVADPLRYAAALDAGVISSLGSEAVSRSALEFMATGVPVVATRVGILPEVVAEPEQLVAPGDPAGLAAALEGLITRPERARSAGAAGRERVRTRYALATLGAGAEEVARAAVDARRRPRRRAGGARVPLTVITIACNEADRIGRALASVDWADQVIVVDSGSTDGTPELAARAGAEVVTHAWEGYARQKSFAIGLARHRWVLWLDADEEVSPRLQARLGALFEPGEPDGGRRAAYELNRRTCYLGRFVRFGGWYPDRKVRLFDRTRAIVDERLVHEGLEVDGAVGFLAGDLRHYSYRNVRHHLAKTHEMARLWAAQNAGRRVGWWAPALHPLAKAVKSYYLRGGFLEGWRGLLIAGIASYSVWLKYKLLRERHRAG